jgi:type I restriction enzyme S subunit
MGWKWTMLSSVAQLESGHTPSRKHPEYWNEGIPWIGIKDATENHGRTLADTYQHVSALGLQNSSARLLPANTVCLSRTASVGFVVVMGRPMATSQDFVNWVCGPSIEAHYLKYIFLAENEALWRFASGTTHQTIYYPEAKAFHVCLPPLAEQKAIAAVLGALDDKIELNRRMNATLEAMARALFQSWFVDFDPVRAKLEGRPPAALDPATAALFPDSFQDSPLGPIPQCVASLYTRGLPTVWFTL